MIYNVKDYGAKGDGKADDTQSIQAAVNAAHAAEGGDIYIPTGKYIVAGQTGNSSLSCVMLYDNITVHGDGRSKSIVQLKNGWSGNITGIFRDQFGVANHDITMHDLTIDGNRAHTTGKIDGWFSGTAPGSALQDSNITLDHVEIKNCGGYGFDPHEQTTNLTITNCSSHNNGLDGFTLDFQINGTFTNNIAYNNDRHGFNICTSSHDLTLTNDRAYGNGGNGIMVQRGSTDIPVPDHITISGGNYYGNAVSGINVSKADHVTVDGANIHDNGTYGVRITGSVGSIVQNSTITNNSLSKNKAYDEVRIESLDDTNGASGRVYQTTGTQIIYNIITDTGVIRAAYGVRELNDGTDYTAISGNTISGEASGDAFVSGANSTYDGGSGGTSTMTAASTLQAQDSPDQGRTGASSLLTSGFGEPVPNMTAAMHSAGGFASLGLSPADQHMLMPNLHTPDFRFIS